MRDRTTTSAAPPPNGEVSMETITWIVTTIESDVRLKKNIKVS